MSQSLMPSLKPLLLANVCWAWPRFIGLSIPNKIEVEQTIPKFPQSNYFVLMFRDNFFIRKSNPSLTKSRFSSSSGVKRTLYNSRFFIEFIPTTLFNFILSVFVAQNPGYSPEGVRYSPCDRSHPNRPGTAHVCCCPSSCCRHWSSSSWRMCVGSDFSALSTLPSPSRWTFFMDTCFYPV